MANVPSNLAIKSASLPQSGPSCPGYSEHHASYSSEVQRWSASALGRLVETISLSISAFHEGGGTRKSRLPGMLFGVSTWGYNIATTMY